MLANALSLIVVTPSGSSGNSRFEHPEKAFVPMDVRLPGRSIFFSVEHPEKQLSGISVIASGRLILRRLEHPEKALAGNDEIVLSSVNTTVFRFVIFANALLVISVCFGR